LSSKEVQKNYSAMETGAWFRIASLTNVRQLQKNSSESLAS